MRGGATYDDVMQMSIQERQMISNLAKENIETWKKAAENPVKEEIKFANDQSKLLFDYLKEGKEDEALQIINTKKKPHFEASFFIYE